MLNKKASTPYIIDSNPSIPQVSTATLAFIDDITLISSSIEGLNQLLDIAQEFYDMNNTKINFSKAKLICNRDLSNPLTKLPNLLAAFNFKSSTVNFTCTLLSLNTSFRFLGV